MNEFPYHICLVALQHPKYSKDYVSVEELREWDRSCTKFNNGILLGKHKDITTDEWVAASDLVVSMTSTILATAAYLRKLCVAYLTPEIFETKLAAGGYKFLPIAKLGACKVATHEEELKHFVGLALFSDQHDVLGLLENQKKHFSCDGKNAARVADVVESLLRK